MIRKQLILLYNNQAFNQALRATGTNRFSNMPSGTVSEKLEKISEQFVKCALITVTITSTTGGSSSAQATNKSRLIFIYDKFTYKIAKNRYKTKLNLMTAHV